MGCRDHPVFNGKYEFLHSLGQGKTSKVYLARSIQEPTKQVALKIYKHDYLLEQEDNIHCVEQEIEILRGLNHPNIVRIEEFGSEGHVLKPSNR